MIALCAVTLRCTLPYWNKVTFLLSPTKNVIYAHIKNWVSKVIYSHCICIHMAYRVLFAQLFFVVIYGISARDVQLSVRLVGTAKGSTGDRFALPTMISIHHMIANVRNKVWDIVVCNIYSEALNLKR